VKHERLVHCGWGYGVIPTRLPKRPTGGGDRRRVAHHWSLSLSIYAAGSHKVTGRRHAPDMTTQSPSLSAYARGYERVAAALQRWAMTNFSLVAENSKLACIPPTPLRKLLPCLNHLPDSGLAFHELLSCSALPFPTQTHTSRAMKAVPDVANQPSER